MDKNCPFTGIPDKIQVMAGYDLDPLQFIDDPYQVTAVLWIQGNRRLIHENYIWIHGEYGGYAGQFFSPPDSL